MQSFIDFIIGGLFFLGLITHIKAFHPAQYSEFLSNKKTGKDKSSDKRNTKDGKQEPIQEIILCLNIVYNKEME